VTSSGGAQHGSLFDSSCTFDGFDPAYGHLLQPGPVAIGSKLAVSVGRQSGRWALSRTHAPLFFLDAMHREVTRA
jgi:hypothetical protein